MTTSDIELDLDSADSILEFMGQCLRLDQELAKDKPCDGFVMVSCF